MIRLPLRINMRLIHMGIVLVSVPLLFELGFIVVLYKLCTAAQEDAARARHAFAVSESINQFAKDTVNVYHKIEGDQLLSPGVDTVALRQQIAHLSEEVQAAAELVKDNPKQSAAIEDARQALNDVAPMFYQVLDVYEHGTVQEVQAKLRGYRKPVQRRLGALALSDLLTIARENKGIADQSWTTQADFQKRIKVTLIIAVFFNIVLSVALAIIFSRGITRRVAILTDNSRRLAEGKPLHKAVGGTDEIAHLDKVFHNMADALAEAERSKQEMIDMVTHDLKTPLTTVSALMEMLEDGVFGKLNDQGVANLKVVGRNVARMSILIRDLLDIEKIKSGMLGLHKEALDVKDLLEEASASVRTLASDKDISIEVSCPFIEIVADNQRLQQVLINLLSNAIKFSPNSSRIDLAAKLEDDIVRFTVSDQGRGVPVNMQQAIFNRFQQTQTSDATVKGGTGLGLAICKALVELHAGQIGVVSEPGKGSTFFFTIPAHAEASAELAASQPKLASKKASA